MNLDLLHRRVRGFRIANLVCGALLLTTVLGVYLTKTMGGDQKSQITEIESQITEEQGQIKLLRAEVAYLGRPERLETIAETQLGLAPIAAARRVSLEDLPRLAGRSDPPAQPAQPSAPATVKP